MIKIEIELNAGASGSLVINSRFWPIGAMFNKVIAPNGNANDPEAPGYHKQH